MLSKYGFKVPSGSAGRLALGWFLLGVLSLLLAGLLALSLVLSRMPMVQEYVPFLNDFHVLLVVHVDLSVLIWFISFAGVFWCIASTDKIMWLGWTALFFSSLGTILIALCPFVGASNPLMNNYIPVLNDSLFLTGLFIFAFGFTLHITWALLTIRPFGGLLTGEGILRYGSYMGAITAALSLVAFIWSYLQAPLSYEPHPYYEVLFWGSGHILQFVHTIMMLVAWLWLVSLANINVKLGPKLLIVLFTSFPVVSLVGLFTYPFFDVTTSAHREIFTIVMQYGMGLPVVIIAAYVVAGVFYSNDYEDKGIKYLKSAIISSLGLFIAGGVIGYLIKGVNVTIPAHYHGVIVGVTIAFMGLSYYLLPALGFRTPKGKIVELQPYIYGGGQLLSIIGLTIAGGYGVQRKVAGVVQGLDSFKKIFSMGLMGIGGVIAIIGGILFLVILLYSMRPSKKLT